jgi:hypothetical protein
MSKMSELFIDIELMLEQGTHPVLIGARLDVPVSMVYDVLEAKQDYAIEELSPFETINS